MARKPLFSATGCALLVVLTLVLMAMFQGEAPGDASVELAVRAGCRNKLHRLYQALVSLREEQGRVPASLQDLVGREGIREEDLVCPAGPAYDIDDDTAYVYDPSAWDDSGRPLIAESPLNHEAWRRLRSPIGCSTGDLPPAQFAAYRDGTVRDIAH
jgi:hypothetical protein